MSTRGDNGFEFFVPSFVGPLRSVVVQAGCPHAPAKLRLEVELGQSVAESRLHVVSRSDEHPGSVTDDFAAGAIGDSNYRHSTCHRLEVYESKALLRWYECHISSAIVPGHIRLGDGLIDDDDPVLDAE